MGYGAGLIGIVAIKVLAPGFYASQDIRTPVRIAVVVLVLTQLMNLVFVPLFQHAGLALSIGIGALINATWLLIGLIRRGSYRPAPGWLAFALQVGAGSVCMGAVLFWANQHFDWSALRDQRWLRIGLMAVLLPVAAAIYFAVIRLCGLRFAQFLKK